jgi:hypothetical protein
MFPIILLLFLVLLGYLYYKESQESGFMSDEDPDSSYLANSLIDDSDTEIDMKKLSRRWSSNSSPNLAQSSFRPMDSVALPVVPPPPNVVEDIQSQIMNDLMGLEIGTIQEKTFTADAYNPMELRQAPPGGIPLIYPEDEYSKITKDKDLGLTRIPAIKDLNVSTISQLQPQSI